MSKCFPLGPTCRRVHVPPHACATAIMVGVAQREGTWNTQHAWSADGVILYPSLSSAGCRPTRMTKWGTVSIVNGVQTMEMKVGGEDGEGAGEGVCGVAGQQRQLSALQPQRHLHLPGSQDLAHTCSAPGPFRSRCLSCAYPRLFMSVCTRCAADSKWAVGGISSAAMRKEGLVPGVGG